MTRLITAGAVLVLAVVFGFIFWNQFSSNQQQLAGNPPTTTSNTQSTTNTTNTSAVPKNDNVSSIETDLNNTDVNGIDSDSSQFNTQLNGF